MYLFIYVLQLENYINYYITWMDIYWVVCWIASNNKTNVHKHKWQAIQFAYLWSSLLENKKICVCSLAIITLLIFSTNFNHKLSVKSLCIFFKTKQALYQTYLGLFWLCHTDFKRFQISSCYFKTAMRLNRKTMFCPITFNIILLPLQTVSILSLYIIRTHDVPAWSCWWHRV